MSCRVASLVRWRLIACLAVLAAAPASAQTVARCGEGWLERIDGYPVLHLKGTGYEMGYQHGALLKELVRSNLGNIVKVEAGMTLRLGPLEAKPRHLIRTIVEIQK